MPFPSGAGQEFQLPESAATDSTDYSALIECAEEFREPRIRWHYTFFILAAIGIAAITASLSFSRALTEDFAEAVTSNYEWVEREALYSELVKLSGECAQPGINVFKSRNIDAERTRLTECLRRFHNRLDIARREAKINVPASELQKVESRLNQIADGIRRTENEVRRVLDMSVEEDLKTVGERLVGLNQASSAVADSIVDLYGSIRADQSQRFESQLQEAERLRASQVWFLLGILVMVVVVALYGNRLSRAAQQTIATITAQTRSLADREARLRTIFNTAAEGIITIDERGIVESCNQATLDFFQQPHDCIIGSPLDDLFERNVTEGSDRRSSRIRDVDSLVGTQQELIAYRPDGSRLIVDFAAAEVRFSDHRIITGILHDITEQKQFEAQLEQARYVAESATRARTEFLANMSHEIRTPMTSILGYAELLSDPQQTADEQSRCVETIRSNADHLLSLINDILDLSRIEAGRMTIEKTRCCPAQIVNEVMALMRSRAAVRQLELIVHYDSPIPEFIHSDPVRLRQILINLIGNAVKFTREGSVRVHLRFEAPSQTDSRIVFRVADTGIGISPAQQSRLFRPFTQADSSTTRCFGGSGLGLSISKCLVELLGGTISLVSAEGLGSTFEFDIQTGATAGAMIDSPDTAKCVPPESLPNQTFAAEPVTASVLLAEDGEDNRRLFTHHLRRAGIQVKCVENGRHAVQAALTPDTHYDLILMDMQMPVMDGYSATRELRMNGYTGKVVALTAHAMTGDRERCLDAGCDDYLTKPVNAVQLIETVRAAARRKQPSETLSTSETAVDPSAPIISEYASDSEMVEIVAEFVDGLTSRLDTLVDAVERKDRDQVAARAHDLKGAGGGFGFPTISETAAAIELVARNGEVGIEECQPLLDELKDICERVAAGLQVSQAGFPVSAGAAEVNSLTGDSEIPQATLSEIEELTSSDPEWREVSDALRNLTTIFRQSPASGKPGSSDNLHSGADIDSPLADADSPLVG